jgi:phosphatidylglycerol---prolipoprotein diacylglyceryl transferase
MSGLNQRFTKPSSLNWDRGFESHLLRKNVILVIIMSFYPGYAPEWVHMVTDILSILIGAWYYIHLYKKRNSEEDSFKRTALLIGAGLGALIGSRLIASLEHPDLFFNPPTWLYYYSVKTVAGGIAGGILGIEIVKFLMKIKESVGDIMVGPLALGIIIGRIGCFMIGLRDGTSGIVTTLPWGTDQGDGLMRHPTALYEIICVALLWFFIHKFKKADSVESGIYFRMFCIGYFTFRFFVEFIKPVHPLFLGITAIQWTSFIVVFCYGISFLKNRATQ